MAKKRCSTCGKLKEQSEFCRDKKSEDDLRSQCKECEREYRKQNKEEIAKKSREYYKRNKESIAEKGCMYRQKHKEEIRIRDQRYNQTHKKEIAEQSCRYRADNKEEIAKKKREDYQAHKEERKARRREYYKRNKEEIAKYKYVYNRTHREEIGAWKTGWRRRNRKRITGYNKKYDQTPKGKLCRKRMKHNRRMHEEQTKATLTAPQWQKILKMQNSKCNLCGRRFTNKLPPTTDHIIPLSKNGGLTFENAQALCQSCNSRKHCTLDPQLIQSWALLT